MNPKIFSEITGNTHGIKFKMMPPINPNSRKEKIPQGGATPTAETIGADANCHAARSPPFGCWEKTIRPAMDDKFFSDDSMGMRKTTSFLLRESILGWPTTAPCSGNGKKSSAG